MTLAHPMPATGTQPVARHENKRPKGRVARSWSTDERRPLGTGS